MNTEKNLQPYALINVAQSMGEQLVSRSSEIELTKNLPSDIVNALAAAGFFKMLVPEEFGGIECDAQTYVKVIEQLAKGDASVAWCTFIYCASSLLSAYLPSDVACELFSPDTVKMCGVYAPTGRASRSLEHGVSGFRVNGKWAWGSGATNADLIMAGCLITGDDGQPELLPNGKARVQSILFKKQQVKLLDNWTAFGLKGTGSGEFEVVDEFVPEHYSACFLTDRQSDRPLYKFPLFGLLGLGIAGVALGLAHAAIDELKKTLSEIKAGIHKKTAAHLALHQITVAKAEAKLFSSRTFLFEAIGNAWRQSQSEDPISLEHRSAVRLATTFAVDHSVEIVQSMYSIGGGAAIFESSRLQQHLRDVLVLSKHILVGSATYELIGSVSLGVEIATDTL